MTAGMCHSWIVQLALTDSSALPDCGGTAALPSEVRNPLINYPF